MNYNLLFLTFSFFLVLSALMVVLSQNTIFSLLFLVSCFVFSSLLLFLLECEFLAFIFIIVYIGAIAILFLFAIMMLESKETDLSKDGLKIFPVGFLLSLFFLIPLVSGISTQFGAKTPEFPMSNLKYIDWYSLIDSIRDIEIYGHVLYSYFVFSFLLVGFILLLVLIGVVYLTNTNSTEISEQSLLKQLSRNPSFFFKN